MKKLIALVLALVLCLSLVPALADAPAVLPPDSTNTLLASLTHNCPNTGIMLPATFTPTQTTYLLTVASWVSRPTFTPVAYNSAATITVNGKTVASGQTSQIIPIDNKPQAVEIVVSYNGASTTYTIYLQRRPSEARTRVSAGFINTISSKNNTWYLDADLVSLKYASEDFTNGSLSSYSNNAKETNVYNYELDVHCSYYYGTPSNPIRANSLDDFANHYWAYGSTLYKIVYIEDKIVAIFPYGADF